MNNGLFTTATVATLLAAPAVMAQETASEWKQTVFIYGMGAAIEGDAQIGNLALPVDLSMSDLFDALEFGAMAAYRIENEDWSFTGDVTYMGLGWQASGPQARVRGELDIDQLTLMTGVGRRITPHLEALVSLAYFDLSTDLEVQLPNQVARASRSADWVDPMIGLHYSVPFADKWLFDLRGEIGGFGVGSDLTWHLMTVVHRQNSDNFGWFFGYRVIAYDYESGQGQNYQRYDLKQHGPGIGVAISF